MAAFTRDILLNDAKDLPSPGWMTALGIVFLFGTIFNELSDFTLEDSIYYIQKGVEFLSIYWLI